MRLKAIAVFAVAALAAIGTMAPRARAQGTGDTVLKPADIQKLLPDHVFYKGQSAPTQLRNSGGVKFADGFFVLATLVDNSGYATGIAAKYQAYFVVETPIKIGGQDLPAGVYGAGFVADHKFVITDVGAHDVLTVSSATDDGLKRPVPLQVVADPAGGYRLYAGRTYVLFNR